MILEEIIKIIAHNRKRVSFDFMFSNKVFGNQLQLDNTASKFELAPFDEVFIRTSPNYELQQFVTVQGQVVFPGVFPAGFDRFIP